MQNFTAIDFTILAIIVVSVAMGLWRGLFREMMALLVWVVAFVIAILFSPSVQDYFGHTITTPEAQLGVSFLVLFMAAYLIGMFVRYWFLKILSPEVSIAGRIWGGVFGLVRGLLFVIVGGFLVAFTTLTQQPIWQQSVLVPAVIKVDSWVAQAVPDDAGAEVMNLFVNHGVKINSKATPQNKFSPNEAL